MNGSLYFELKTRLANRSEVCRNKISIKNSKVFVGDLTKPIASINARPEHENKADSIKTKMKWPVIRLKNSVIIMLISFLISK
jgi:hypothetical protein